MRHWSQRSEPCKPPPAFSLNKLPERERERKRKREREIGMERKREREQEREDKKQTHYR